MSLNEFAVGHATPLLKAMLPYCANIFCKITAIPMRSLHYKQIWRKLFTMCTKTACHKNTNRRIAVRWLFYIIKWFPNTLSCEAATRQLFEWFSPSARPSVCPTVTPLSLFSHHRIIVKFSRFITNSGSEVHAKGQGQRSKIKVTKVETLFIRFRTITPI